MCVYVRTRVQNESEGVESYYTGNTVGTRFLYLFGGLRSKQQPLYFRPTTSAPLSRLFCLLAPPRHRLGVFCCCCCCCTCACVSIFFFPRQQATRCECRTTPSGMEVCPRASAATQRVSGEWQRCFSNSSRSNNSSNSTSCSRDVYITSRFVRRSLRGLALYGITVWHFFFFFLRGHAIVCRMV